MNEELRAANEEIQSSNEELQSMNEELETAKEELQSTNEELTTLNEELENRNQELAQVNNDLVNLLTSVEIPIIMLDSALRIRRFNTAAQRSLNLIAADVGRPLTDLKTTLNIDNLEAQIAEVIETLEVREMEVQDRNGRWQSLRIRPYRTTDNKIDGAVLALVSLDEFRRTSPVPRP
jgi:two-component system CheB/CheR fusion protein